MGEELEAGRKILRIGIRVNVIKVVSKPGVVRGDRLDFTSFVEMVLEKFR